MDKFYAVMCSIEFSISAFSLLMKLTIAILSTVDPFTVLYEAVGYS